MTEAAEPGSKPAIDPIQTAELVIITNAWATPMQIGRAKAMISSAEPTSTAGIKLGKILFEHRIISHEQMHQLEQILRQQELLEGFQLLKKLGSGGMGTVFLAKHLSSGQEVALKVVNNRLADDAD